MTEHIRYYWIYLLFLTAAVATSGYELLPERELDLLQASGQISLFKDSDTHGTTIGEWLDQDKLHIRCTFDASTAGNKYCGIDFSMGDGVTQGEDLSNYRSVKIKLANIRNAGYVRIFIRNFVEYISSHLDPVNTSKYMRVTVPTRGLDNALDLSLDQFSLADWWAKKNSLPPSQVFPEFNNVVSIGVDFPHPIRLGENELQVESITLVGAWISKEGWNQLVFITCLLIVISTHAVKLILKRTNQHRTQQSTDKQATV